MNGAAISASIVSGEILLAGLVGSVRIGGMNIKKERTIFGTLTEDARDILSDILAAPPERLLRVERAIPPSLKSIGFGDVAVGDDTRCVKARLLQRLHQKDVLFAEAVLVRSRSVSVHLKSGEEAGDARFCPSGRGVSSFEGEACTCEAFDGGRKDMPAMEWGRAIGPKGVRHKKDHVPNIPVMKPTKSWFDGLSVR